MSEKKQRVLFVDDEPNILNALARLLQNEPYTVLTATSAAAGIELLEAENGVEVVISDYRMPERNGVDFLREVHQRWPLAVRMVLSGFADMPAIIEAINQGKIYRFLPKPWDIEELKGAIKEGLAQHSDSAEVHNFESERVRRLEERNRQLETQLEEQGRKLKVKNQFYDQTADIINALPLVLIGIDDDGQIVFCNKRAEDLFSTALTGSRWDDIFDTYPLGKLRQLLEERGSDVTTLEIGGYRLQGRLNYLRPTICRGILLACEGANHDHHKTNSAR